MVKYHTDSEGGNPLPPHGLLFPQRVFFYMHHPTDRITHTTAFGTPVVAKNKMIHLAFQIPGNRV